MSERFEQNAADEALRRGLHDLAVPDPSPDFDARVHAALRQRIPWWWPAWTALRPVFSATACSLVITLALLQWLTNSPTALPRVSPAAGTNAIALDRKLERMDLSTATLSGFWSLPRPLATPPSAPPEPRRAVPDRHSQLLPSPTA